MNFRDLIWWVTQSLRGHPLRAVLTALGMLVGTASVILLTSIGEGLRVYILSQFTQFGTHLLAVVPGRTETLGIPGVATTVRRLTREDAQALLRIPGVEAMVPLVFGSAPVEWKGRSRSVFVFGVSRDLPVVWQMDVQQGVFLPTDPWQDAPLAVLGPKLKQELFGSENALGAYVHIGGRRFQVIGVMAPKGQMLGFDMDDLAYIPVSAALALFHREGLMEVDVRFSPFLSPEGVAREVRRLLRNRHGEEDFTIITQSDMLSTLDRILRVMNLAVAAIAGISLVVGAIGILTVLWISVQERTREIGLELALGATPAQIRVLFLAEATFLAGLGGIAGVGLGLGLAGMLYLLVPGLPVRIPTFYTLLALGTCIGVGLLSGVLPAQRAARLDPLEALRAE